MPRAGLASFAVDVEVLILAARDTAIPVKKLLSLWAQLGIGFLHPSVDFLVYVGRDTIVGQPVGVGQVGQPYSFPSCSGSRRPVGLEFTGHTVGTVDFVGSARSALLAGLVEQFVGRMAVYAAVPIKVRSLSWAVWQVRILYNPLLGKNARSKRVIVELTAVGGGGSSLPSCYRSAGTLSQIGSLRARSALVR